MNQNRKILVAFYSRTGSTKKAVEKISSVLKCDVEEIKDTEARSGVLGYIKSGYEATTNKTTNIEPIKKDPSLYDVVILCTPVWAANVSTPVRAYILQNKNKFKEVAFLAICAGSGADKTVESMEKLCEKKPLLKIAIKKSEIESDNFLINIKKLL